jgi:hypothetical protein
VGSAGRPGTSANSRTPRPGWCLGCPRPPSPPLCAPRGTPVDGLSGAWRPCRPARIGVDEIAYRKGRRFLTIVTDHDPGHVVWVREGRTQTALIAFLDTLGPGGRDRTRAISMDMTRISREAMPT